MKDNITIIKRFFRLVKGDKKKIVQLFLSSILGNLIMLLIPYSASQIIKQITEQTYLEAYQWAFILGITYFGYAIIWLWNYKAYASNFKYCYTAIQHKILNKVATYDDNFTSHVSRGKLINTTNHDVVELSSLIDTICEYITTSSKMLILFFIFIKINVLIGIVVIAVVILYHFLIDITNKKINHHLFGQRRQMDKISDLFSQTLSGLREVKVFQILPKLNQKFDGIKRQFEYQYGKKREYMAQKDLLVPLLINFTKVGIYLFFIYLISKGRITLDVLVLVVSYYESIIVASNEVLRYSNTIREMDISIKRINSILNYHSPNVFEVGDFEQDDIIGTVEFRHVTFGYKETSIVKNISFKARPHQITTLVGTIGSGKSTLFHLLLRLYKMDQGEILIDGKSIYDYSRRVYPSNVSVVNQKPFVFNMSIRHNLDLIDTNRKRQEEACKRVGIHDFIMSLPKGYRTLLKEDATDVSGGQKQLISLARTLLSQAEILLFDEVTSALDPKTTKQVVDLLEDLKEDHTILMITHSPSLMELSDHIIVLDHGRIVGTGSHDHLLESNVIYQQLINKK